MMYCSHSNRWIVEHYICFQQANLFNFQNMCSNLIYLVPYFALPLWKMSKPFISQPLNHTFLAHLAFSHHIASVVRPSVHDYKKDIILWNCSANFNETFVEFSLDGPFPKLCLMASSSKMMAARLKIEWKKVGNFWHLFWTTTPVLVKLLK